MNLRWKLLAPPALCAAALLLVLAAGRTLPREAWLPLALGLVALLVVVGLTEARLLLRPLARLGAAARTGEPLAHPVEDALEPLRTELARMHALIGAQEAELATAHAAERNAQAALKQSEERYLVAVRGTNDGMWEWDLASNEVRFSPRWKAMLGFTDSEFANRYEAWIAQLHPEDAPAVEAALREHLEGRSSHFERQLRMRHKDGHYRWLLSRGAALRRASGKPYRMVGLDTDINRVKRVEEIVKLIAEGTAGTQGELFFRAMVRHFAAALEVAAAFVTECVDRPTTRVRTLAFWKQEDFRDNIEFDLAGTPCESVVKQGEMCFVPSGVGRRFPRDAAYESYIGVPIFGSDGTVIGHLAFFDTRQMNEEVLVEPIFRIFCARAGAELERRSALDALARLEAPAS